MKMMNNSQDRFFNSLGGGNGSQNKNILNQYRNNYVSHHTVHDYDQILNENSSHSSLPAPSSKAVDYEESDSLPSNSNLEDSICLIHGRLFISFDDEFASVVNADNIKLVRIIVRDEIAVRSVESLQLGKFPEILYELNPPPSTQSGHLLISVMIKLDKMMRNPRCSTIRVRIPDELLRHHQMKFNDHEDEEDEDNDDEYYSQFSDNSNRINSRLSTKNNRNKKFLPSTQNFEVSEVDDEYPVSVFKRKRESKVHSKSISSQTPMPSNSLTKERCLVVYDDGTNLYSYKKSVLTIDSTTRYLKVSSKAVIESKFSTDLNIQKPINRIPPSENDARHYFTSTALIDPAIAVATAPTVAREEVVFEHSSKYLTYEKDSDSHLRHRLIISGNALSPYDSYETKHENIKFNSNLSHIAVPPPSIVIPTSVRVVSPETFLTTSTSTLTHTAVPAAMTATTSEDDNDSLLDDEAFYGIENQNIVDPDPSQKYPISIPSSVMLPKSSSTKSIKHPTKRNRKTALNLEKVESEKAVDLNPLTSAKIPSLSLSQRQDDLQTNMDDITTTTATLASEIQPPPLTLIITDHLNNDTTTNISNSSNHHHLFNSNEDSFLFDGESFLAEDFPSDHTNNTSMLDLFTSCMIDDDFLLDEKLYTSSTTNAATISIDNEAAASATLSTSEPLRDIPEKATKKTKGGNKKKAKQTTTKKHSRAKNKSADFSDISLQETQEDFHLLDTFTENINVNFLEENEMDWLGDIDLHHDIELSHISDDDWMISHNALHRSFAEFDGGRISSSSSGSAEELLQSDATSLFVSKYGYRNSFKRNPKLSPRAAYSKHLDRIRAVHSVVTNQAPAWYANVFQDLCNEANTQKEEEELDADIYQSFSVISTSSAASSVTNGGGNTIVDVDAMLCSTIIKSIKGIAMIHPSPDLASRGDALSVRQSSTHHHDSPPSISFKFVSDLDELLPDISRFPLLSEVSPLADWSQHALSDTSPTDQDRQLEVDVWGRYFTEYVGPSDISLSVILGLGYEAATASSKTTTVAKGNVSATTSPVPVAAATIAAVIPNHSFIPLSKKTTSQLNVNTSSSNLQFISNKYEELSNLHEPINRHLTTTVLPIPPAPPPVKPKSEKAILRELEKERQREEKLQAKAKKEAEKLLMLANKEKAKRLKHSMSIPPFQSTETKSMRSASPASKPRLNQNLAGYDEIKYHQSSPHSTASTSGTWNHLPYNEEVQVPPFSAAAAAKGTRDMPPKKHRRQFSSPVPSSSSSSLMHAAGSSKGFDRTISNIDDDEDDVRPFRGGGHHRNMTPPPKLARQQSDRTQYYQASNSNNSNAMHPENSFGTTSAPLMMPPPGSPPPPSTLAFPTHHSQTGGLPPFAAARAGSSSISISASTMGESAGLSPQPPVYGGSSGKRERSDAGHPFFSSTSSSSASASAPLLTLSSHYDSISSSSNIHSSKRFNRNASPPLVTPQPGYPSSSMGNHHLLTSTSASAPTTGSSTAISHPTTSHGYNTMNQSSYSTGSINNNSNNNNSQENMYSTTLGSSTNFPNTSERGIALPAHVTIPHINTNVDVVSPTKAYPPPPSSHHMTSSSSSGNSRLPPSDSLPYSTTTWGSLDDVSLSDRDRDREVPQSQFSHQWGSRHYSDYTQNTAPQQLDHVLYQQGQLQQQQQHFSINSNLMPFSLNVDSDRRWNEIGTFPGNSSSSSSSGHTSLDPKSKAHSGSSENSASSSCSLTLSDD